MKRLLLVFLVCLTTPGWTQTLTLQKGQDGPTIGVGITRPEVEKLLGPWPEDSAEEYATFQGVLTVYIRRGKVAQLSAVQSPAGLASWALQKDGKELAHLGEKDSVLKSRLGAPRLTLFKSTLDVWIFSFPTTDLGLMFSAHSLEAIILTPAGKLQDVLFLTGYQRRS